VPKLPEPPAVARPGGGYQVAVALR
jgi:hypothetical protein